MDLETIATARAALRAAFWSQLETTAIAQEHHVEPGEGGNSNRRDDAAGVRPPLLPSASGPPRSLKATKKRLRVVPAEQELPGPAEPYVCAWGKEDDNRSDGQAAPLESSDPDAVRDLVFAAAQERERSMKWQKELPAAGMQRPVTPDVKAPPWPSAPLPGSLALAPGYAGGLDARRLSASSASTSSADESDGEDHRAGAGRESPPAPPGASLLAASLLAIPAPAPAARPPPEEPHVSLMPAPFPPSLRSSSPSPAASRGTSSAASRTASSSPARDPRRRPAPDERPADPREAARSLPASPRPPPVSPRPVPAPAAAEERDSLYGAAHVPPSPAPPSPAPPAAGRAPSPFASYVASIRPASRAPPSAGQPFPPHSVPPSLAALALPAHARLPEERPQSRPARTPPVLSLRAFEGLLAAMAPGTPASPRGPLSARIWPPIPPAPAPTASPGGPRPRAGSMYPTAGVLPATGVLPVVSTATRSRPAAPGPPAAPHVRSKSSPNFPASRMPHALEGGHLHFASAPGPGSSPSRQQPPYRPLTIRSVGPAAPPAPTAPPTVGPRSSVRIALFPTPLPPTLGPASDR